jgi:hypothetical protein
VWWTRFGRRRDITRRIKKLKLGKGINTAHVERFNATARAHLARLGRRTRALSHRRSLLSAALSLSRDVYNFVRVHQSLAGQTPAMAIGLMTTPLSMEQYILRPVHVDAWQRSIWQEEHQKHTTSALDLYNQRKGLPT